MNTAIPCGPDCLIPPDAPAAAKLSPSARGEASFLVGRSVVRAIAADPEKPGHPFSLADSTVTLQHRRELLERLMKARPCHVLEITAICECSFQSPWQEGSPLQDFGLGPDSHTLVAPASRRIHHQPQVLERLLAELADGLTAMHDLGVAHGDPALMNAFCGAGDDHPQALWVDLNSVRAATGESVAVDVAGFVLTCVWPALLDADHHSPSLFDELARIQAGGSFGLEEISATLRTKRSDHRSGDARASLVSALRSHFAGGAGSPLQGAISTIQGLMAPVYFLEQTRTDQTARFLQAVLHAERTRNTLLEEERTRLVNLRYEKELAQNRAAIEELRSWAKELQEAVRYHHDRANSAEAREAALGGELAVARTEAARLVEELAARTRELGAIHGSKGWRLLKVLWAVKRAAGRLSGRPTVSALLPTEAPVDETVATTDLPHLDESGSAELQPAELTNYLPERFPRGTGRPVLVSLPWFVTGGADRFVEYLLEHWRTAGRTAVVVTTTKLEPNMQSRFDELLRLTPYAYNLNAMGPPELWSGFVKAVLDRLDRPVIFNVGSQWMYDSLPRLTSTRPGLRVIDQQFNDIGHLTNNRRVKDHLDLTVAAHQALADVIRMDGRDARKVATAYVGIPALAPAAEGEIDGLRSELGISAGAKVALFLGRFSQEKRPEWVVALAAELAAEEVNVVMVGSGPEESRLRPGIEAIPNLVWRKHVDNLVALLGLSDLLVLPSRIEGIPLTVMEAVSLGVPVVATRVGGLGELENIPGFRLCDPDDFPGFAAAVRQSLAVPTQAGIALPRQFQLEEMLATYDRLIEEPRRDLSSAAQTSGSET